MSWLSRLLGTSSAAPVVTAEPKFSNVRNVQEGSIIISSPKELEDFLRRSGGGEWGRIADETALRVAAVNRCNAIIADYVATTSVDVMRTTADDYKEYVNDHPLSIALKRKPNRWQTPMEFKRMVQTFVNFRGNAYALRVQGVKVFELLPLHPDRVKVEQDDQLRLWYTYRSKAGKDFRFPQTDIVHWRGLTLDGVVGVTPLTFARRSIEAALTMEAFGQKVFENGAMPKMVLTHPALLTDEAYDRLKQSIDDTHAGVENAGKTLILEEGLTVNDVGLTNEDAQFLESRRFTRTDIAMFFGVPPHMIGETDKSTSWGTGIESQETGFRIYTGEGHLIMWEETLRRDCLDEILEPDLYVRFNRNSRARADMDKRWSAYVKAMQWGVMSPNEVRALEDMNPREGGDIYYPPPNASANADGTGNDQGDQGDNKDETTAADNKGA